MFNHSVAFSSINDGYLADTSGGLGLYKTACEFCKSVLAKRDLEAFCVGSEVSMTLELNMISSYGYANADQPMLEKTFSLYEMSQSRTEGSDIESGDICMNVTNTFVEILGHLDGKLVPFKGLRVEPQPIEHFTLNYVLSAVAKALHEQDFYERVEISDIAKHMLTCITDPTKLKESVDAISNISANNAFIDKEGLELHPMATTNQFLAYIHAMLIDCDGLGLRPSIEEIVNNEASGKADKIEKIIFLLIDNGALPPLQSEDY